MAGTGCPNLIFSCSNISCSIWFCCGGGGSNKEHEREQQKRQQQAAVSNNPQASPPHPQVITLPEHLKEPCTTSVEQPAAPPPPAPLPPIAVAETAPQDRIIYERRPPPAPPIAVAATAAPQDTIYERRPPAPPPRRVPPTETTCYLPQPTTTQQQATWPPTLQTPTLPAAAAAPKVHDPWTQTTQISPHTHPALPVWSQAHTPSSAPILPPRVPSPAMVLHDMQCPHMQMVPAASHAQSEMVHKAPPTHPPRPARQPSKTYYYHEADVVPPQAVLPLGDSQPIMGYCPQEHWE